MSKPVVALYARVSTDQQTTENQIPDLERLVAARGWQIDDARRYVETVSGTAQRRPELDRMLEDAHQGRFNVLVVWALDRLGRGGVAQVAGIVEKLDKSGVTLVSVKESWADGTGPARSLLIGVMAWIAQQERARLLERLDSARRRLEKQGRAWGRPRLLDATQVARIRKLKAAGKSDREVAVALKIKRSTLRDALARPA